MFKKYGLGEIVEWGDKDGYINAVRKICENYDDYTKNMELFLHEQNRENESKRQQDCIMTIFN